MAPFSEILSQHTHLFCTYHTALSLFPQALSHLRTSSPAVPCVWNALPYSLHDRWPLHILKFWAHSFLCPLKPGTLLLCLHSVDREHVITYLCINLTVQLSSTPPRAGAFSVPSLLCHTRLCLATRQSLDTFFQRKVNGE